MHQTLLRSANLRRRILRVRLSMTGTPASAVEVAAALTGASATWPDELWTGSISIVDAVLRSYYRIREFTDDPNCVLRVGLSEARSPVLLSDGTQIRVGEPIGTFHFWNEHLPAYPASGPNLAWACKMRDRVVGSLRAFDDYIDSDPVWQDVQAICAETALPTRLGASQIGRVFRRYGFELIPTNPSLGARLHGFGECFVLWGLTRAFNPAALPRQPFLRDRHELWISRSTLRRCYARSHNQTATATLQHHGV
jgi:hypothetical protein